MESERYSFQQWYYDVKDLLQHIPKALDGDRIIPWGKSGKYTWFEEYMCMLYDDRNFVDFIEKFSNKYPEKDSTIKKLKTIQNALDKVDRIDGKKMVEDENWRTASKTVISLFEDDKFGEEITIFYNPDEFIDWLEKNSYLEDTYVTDTKIIKERCLYIEIWINLEQVIAGGFGAGDKQKRQQYKFICKFVKEYSIDESKIKQWKERGGLCVPEIDLPVEKDNLIGLSLNSACIFYIYCSSIEIQKYEQKDVVVMPAIGGYWIYYEINMETIPTPQEWLDWLKKEGVDDAVWRYYESNEVKVSEVPNANYTGWFLQKRNRLKKNGCGVFFSTVEIDDKQVATIDLENKDEEYTDIFSKLCIILNKMNIVAVRTGNCILTGTQWKKYLETGLLPYSDKLGVEQDE